MLPWPSRSCESIQNASLRFCSAAPGPQHGSPRSSPPCALQCKQRRTRRRDGNPRKQQLPAKSVLTVPSGVILRTRWLPWSTMMMLSSPSTASPVRAVELRCCAGAVRKPCRSGPCKRAHGAVGSELAHSMVVAVELRRCAGAVRKPLLPDPARTSILLCCRDDDELSPCLCVLS